MTDFVAVIRRAVDGLKDNNPEMRAKVYDKARAAVLKQLENMKPRPTDDVIARQMAKLDDAVVSVEHEHAAALPAVLPTAGRTRPEPVSKIPDASRTQDPIAPNFDNYVKAPAAPVVRATGTWETPAAPPAAAIKAPDLLWMPDDPDSAKNSTSIAAPLAPEKPNYSYQNPAPTAAVAMPEAIADIPWDVSPFDVDTPKPGPVKTGSAAGATSGLAPLPQANNDWDEIDDLSAFETPISAAAKTAPTTGKSKASDVEKIVSKLEGKSFKAQAKTTKINYAGLVAGLAGLIIVGVGGYGVWLYRDSIMALVNSTTPAATIQNASTKPSTPDAKSTVPAANDKPKQTQVASANSKDAAGNGKFTQRLLPDGSETSEALTNAPKPDGKEGKSVAAQTVKGKDVAAVAAPSNAGTLAAPAATPAIADSTQPSVPAAPATPTTPAAQTPSTTEAAAAPQTSDATPAPDPNAATGPAQKMFLYEERLGQPSPTQVNGTVSWSVANDTTATGGKPQSEIQAKITVPERGMSALITFKRNTDKSLPASHVVELVFSLPKDFDGGGIDGVQRIAMKQNEQDKGNSLIAVPAKITDDFHMIALNDDPAAISSNIDLLKNRNWIDIPITYRNGRRALITIEKGPDGSADFNKVMAEWAALSPA